MPRSVSKSIRLLPHDEHIGRYLITHCRYRTNSSTPTIITNPAGRYLSIPLTHLPPTTTQPRNGRDPLTVVQIAVLPHIADHLAESRVRQFLHRHAHELRPVGEKVVGRGGGDVVSEVFCVRVFIARNGGLGHLQVVTIVVVDVDVLGG